MGRRKWKLYQESMSRNYLQPLNNNIKPRINEEYQKEQQEETSTTTTTQTKQGGTGGEEQRNGLDGRTTTDHAATAATREEADRQQQQAAEAEERLKDWSPESSCYFCVDGKLDSEHTAHGVLVRKFLVIDTLTLAIVVARQSCKPFRIYNQNQWSGNEASAEQLKI